MPRKKENKRSDGYYEVKVIIDRTYDGKPIYKSFYSSKSKTDARAKAEAYKLDQMQKQEQIERMTFKDYAADYLERLKQHVRANTYSTSECVFRLHLVPFFGDMELRSIKKADVEKFIAVMQKQYQVSYIKKQIGDFAALMNDAMYNGYIDKPPCHNLKYKHAEKKEKHDDYEWISGEYDIAYHYSIYTLIKKEKSDDRILNIFNSTDRIYYKYDGRVEKDASSISFFFTYIVPLINDTIDSGIHPSCINYDYFHQKYLDRGKIYESYETTPFEF